MLYTHAVHLWLSQGPGFCKLLCHTSLPPCASQQRRCKALYLLPQKRAPRASRSAEQMARAAEPRGSARAADVAPQAAGLAPRLLSRLAVQRQLALQLRDLGAGDAQGGSALLRAGDGGRARRPRHLRSRTALPPPRRAHSSAGPAAAAVPCQRRVWTQRARACARRSLSSATAASSRRLRARSADSCCRASSRDCEQMQGRACCGLA